MRGGEPISTSLQICWINDLAGKAATSIYLYPCLILEIVSTRIYSLPSADFYLTKKNSQGIINTERIGLIQGIVSCFFRSSDASDEEKKHFVSIGPDGMGVGGLWGKSSSFPRNGLRPTQNRKAWYPPPNPGGTRSFGR